MQTTLKTSAVFSGAGLHSGKPSHMTVLPASAEYGIWFCRTDVTGVDPLIPARWDAAEQVPLCTRLVNDAGVSISTVEHIMAALAGCGIQNALIEVDGPEVPILDGSSAQFVEAFIKCGFQRQDAPNRVIRVLREVEVRRGDAVARLSPADTLEIDFHIDFADAAIGQQDKSLSMANGTFVRELCDSRTFCRQADVEYMHANGLALGGNVENAVVVDGDKVLSPGGLRHSDEAVRHKMLDALGDLALAGAPILGRYSGHRAGHSLTNELLRALFAQPDAYRMEICDADTARVLPGVGVKPADLRAVA
ncbi:UDP-3-O-[3-hydroxymyristoyl] N-acetylglucosamine deacetylase [Actibacterium atlanticum]|uniref:UDP-3-O-acyl-N-acetylglucosamine deacetylase n=1 Tax=Actibacterium atlanticum TaxID=1461693 RepID=A0A058ZQJ4_9RHOB|nr:UDP-3-O-acyl-N-acetylglucosamine deacetylase [Actibacterium atlanticum]KCV83116.1 UDP-3-O-[3-hydroxymyristoyl] N-acetylglucosamine deacetylase [Actibacterium atlanticum]